MSALLWSVAIFWLVALAFWPARVARRKGHSWLLMPDSPFSGSAGRTIGDSTPDWDIIGDVEPPPGAPNILLVLIYDAGFG